MKTLLLVCLALLSCSITLAATSRTPKKMKAFRSERELKRYFDQVTEKQKRPIRQVCNLNFLIYSLLGIVAFC